MIEITIPTDAERISAVLEQVDALLELEVDHRTGATEHWTYICKMHELLAKLRGARDRMRQ